MFEYRSGKMFVSRSIYKVYAPMWVIRVWEFFGATFVED